ncbi:MULTISPECIES: GAF domain-containing protein [unclassified Exiguobacterium]|uniref:GAF domain-containing protein n=1 Tax=unclassified Exiguobacterium TaxID=2644629 RepID=UPI001BE98EE8|nr:MULTISPECIES: GAF domain-containing protein [unclassified Exiguobacterium]
MIYTQHRQGIKWIEMIVSILIIGTLDYMFNLSILKWTIDPLIFYILLFSLRYGLLGAFASFLFTMIYHLSSLAWAGEDVLLFVYDRGELSWIILHFLVAISCGMFSTSFQERYLSLRLRQEEVTEENERLRDTLEKLRVAQEAMRNKVLESNHTLTNIYRIGTELDQSVADIVRDKLLQILQDSFDAKEIAIYHVDASRRTLRLHIRFGDKELLPQTMFIDPEQGIYQRMFQKQAIAIRTIDETDVPLLIAPIRYDGRIQEVVVIQSIAFERLTNYEMHVMQLIVDWTGSRIEKAMLMEWIETRHELIEGTRIFKREHFEKKVKYQEYRREHYGQPYSLVQLDIRNTPFSLIELELILRQSMREIDLIGFDENTEHLQFLLPGTPQEHANRFLERIKAVYVQKGGRVQ